MSTPAPPSVSDVIGNAAAPAVIRWRERDYPVARPTPAILSRLEVEVANQAKANLKELRDTGVYDAGEYAAAVATLHSDLRARRHAVGGELFTDLVNGMAGGRLVLWACVAALDPTVTPADVAAMTAEVPDEVAFAAALVMPDFYRAGGGKMGAPPAAVERQVAEYLAAILPRLTPDRRAKVEATTTATPTTATPTTNAPSPGSPA